MSRTIDERVVSMQFDNKQFETNVRTSISTLDKLKQSLNLTGAAKGLDNINAAAKSCTLAPLGNAVESVKVKFSALEVMAVTALANITNTAVNYGKRLVSSLTIDQVTAGWTKYEQKTSSVQTIMNATGKSINEVNGYLDKLMWYSDETSYGFTDMTQSLAQLTSAGGDIEKLIPMIEGIANATAFAGKGASEFSRAIYNLNQSYSAGYLQYMDWKSLDLAGVSSKQLKQVFIDTAIALGKLDENGRTASGTLVEIGNFGQTLQEKWADTTVMEAAFGKFAELTDAAYEAVQAGEYDTASEAIAALADGYDEIASKAFKSAQEAKTFTEAIDATKDAVSSGWMKSAELIFGNYDQAKVLWTDLANTLWEVFASGAEARNEMLEGALTSKWDKFVDKINDAGIETDKFEEKTKDVLKKHGYDVDVLIEKYGSLEQIFKNGAAPVAILKEAISGLGKSMLDLSSIQGILKKGSTGDDVKKIQQALKDLGYDLGKWDVDGILGSKTTEAIKAFQEAQGLKVDGIIGPDTIAALEKASEKTNELSGNLDELLDGITELGGRELLIDSFKNAWEALTKPIKAVKEAWREVFPPMTSERLYNIIDGIHSFTEKLIMSDESAEKIKRTFKGLFAVLDVIKKIVGGGLSFGFRILSKILESFDLNILDVTAAAGDALVKFRDWLFENNRLSKGFDKVVKGAVKVAKAIYDWIKAFVKLPIVQKNIARFRTAISDTFDNVGKYFSGGLEKIKEFIDRVKSMDGISLENIGKIFKDFKENVLGYFFNFDIGKIFSNIGEALRKFKDDATKYLEAAGIKFDDIKGKIIDFVSTVKEKLGEHKGSIAALGTLLVIIFILSKIKKAVTSIAGFAKTFSGISDSIQNFFNSFATINKAKAQKIKTEAIWNIAKSITLLAGAIFIISKIPEDDLWRAVGVIGIISATLLAMMALTRLISKIGKDSSLDTAKFGAMMASLGVALLLMAASIKILGGMDPDQLKQGGIAVASFLGIMMVMMTFTKTIKGNDIDKFGKMMRKLSVSLLFLAAAVYIFGKMDTKTLVQGGLAVTSFLMIMSGMMAMNKDVSGIKYINNFGKMIRNISLSLLLLAGVVYIFGKMDTQTLIKGGLAVVTFVGLMLAAMSLTSSIPGNVDKFGKMMLSINAGLLLMALSVKILGSMDTKTLAKGTLVIAAFSGIVMGLMSATSLLGKYSFNAGKMGLMILSFSAAMLLITASIAALSMIDGNDITKALAAITGVGLIFAGLLAVTKFAKNVKMGTIIGLSIAVAVLAGSIAALSFVDPSKLQSATAAISIVLGAFAIVMASTKFVNNKAIATLLIMGGMVAILGYVLKELTNGVTDTTGALKVALGLSAVVLALSGACALISKAGKGANLKSVGMGLLLFAGVVGIIGIVSAIAISQLPKIAKKLSEFMEELKPFIEGITSITGIKASTINSLKTLSEAIFILAGAGSKYAITNTLTGGGVERAFSNFASFIKEVLPAIKDLALDVSGEGVSINTDNLNAIIGAIAGIAEAASKAPSITIGVGASLFGIGAYISIPQLTSFTEWMKEAVPLMKDLALEVSGEDVVINTDNLNAIIESIKSLAEAASNAPTTTELQAITLLGAVEYKKFTDLDGFKTFIKDATEAMSGFASGIKDLDLTDADIKNITSICETVKLLAEAAKEAPSVELAGAFTKFGGGGYINFTELDAFGAFVSNISTSLPSFASSIKDLELSDGDIDTIKSICETVKLLAEAANEAPSVELAGAFTKFGGGGYIKIPLLSAFTGWITKVVPIMQRFAVNISNASIEEKDLLNLKSMCQSIKYLCEAAGELPSYEAGVALSDKFGAGIYIKVPALDAFVLWIQQVVPIMSRFVVSGIREPGITEAEASTLKSICKAVEYLGLAAGSAPSIKAAFGFAKFAKLSAAGAYIELPQLTAFKDWIVEVVPVMSGFAIDVKEAGITEGDTNTLISICDAIECLGNAAGSAPSDKAAAGFTTFGNMIAAGGYIEHTNLTAFKDWIVEVAPVMSGFAIDVKEASITEEDGKKISSICEAVKILAEAADLGGADSEATVGFAAFGPAVGAFVQITTEDLTAFTEWISEIAKEGGALDKLVGISTSATNFTTEDGIKLQSICQSVRILAEAAKFAPKKTEYYGIFQDWVEEGDVQALVDWVDKIIPYMEKMATTLGGTEISIDITKLISITTALKDVAEAMYDFSISFNIETLDMETLKIQVDGLGDCMVSFSDKVANVNTSAISSAARAAKNICDVLTALTRNEEGGNVWMTFDSSTFQTKACEIADAMKAFGDKMEGVNISSSTTQATALSTMITQLSSVNYSGVDKFVKAINDLATANFEGLSDAVSKADGFSSVGANIISSLVGGINDNAGDVTEALSSALATAAAGIADSSESFSVAGSNIVDSIASGINDNDSAETAVEDVMSKASSAAGSSTAYLKFYSAGSYLVQGFALGITLNTFRAQAAAKAMADKAYQSAKSTLQINSPSKIFRWLGSGVPEGFALGIDDLGGIVKKSSVSMAETAINGTKNAISRIAEAINSDIDAQPTIRPVVDLSNVRAGAGAINGMFDMSPSVGTMSTIGSINRMMSNRQNGVNDDVISAIDRLGKKLGNTSGDTYNVNGITYDDSSNVSDAVRTIIRAARVERRK